MEEACRAAAFPHEVWAPEVIGPVVSTLVAEIEKHTEARGRVPDWTTLKFHARDDETFSMVIVAVTVDLLP